MEYKDHIYTSDISAISHKFDAPSVQPQSLIQIIEEDIQSESCESPFKSSVYSTDKNVRDIHIDENNKNQFKVKKISLSNGKNLNDKQRNIHNYSPILQHSTKYGNQNLIEERHFVEVPAVMEVDVYNRYRNSLK